MYYYNVMSAEQTVKTKAKNILKNAGWSAPVFALLTVFMLFASYLFLLDLIQIFTANVLGVDFEKLSQLSAENLIKNFSSNIINISLSILLQWLPPLFLLILSPLFNGFTKAHYSMIITGKSDLNDILYFFSNRLYLKTLGLNLSYVLRMIIPAFLSFLPLSTYTLMCTFFFKDFIDTNAYTIIYIILYILSFIILQIYALKYFLVFKYYCEDQSLRIRDYFEFSSRGMFGYTSSIIKLTLTFIPYILLSLLMLPMLYTVPYMYESYCVSANFLIEIEKERRNYDESISVYNSLQ